MNDKAKCIVYIYLESNLQIKNKVNKIKARIIKEGEDEESKGRD